MLKNLLINRLETTMCDSTQLPGIDFTSFTEQEYEAQCKELEKQRVCIDCMLQFAYKRSYELHRKNKVCLHPCGICDYEYSNKKEKEEHEKVCRLSLVEHMKGNRGYYLDLFRLDPTLLDDRTKKYRQAVIKEIESGLKNIVVPKKYKYNHALKYRMYVGKDNGFQDEIAGLAREEMEVDEKEKEKKEKEKEQEKEKEKEPENEKEKEKENENEKEHEHNGQINKNSSNILYEDDEEPMDPLTELFESLREKDFRSPIEIKEAASKDAYNLFYNQYMAMARGTSINKKLDALGPLTPEQIYVFCKNDLIENGLYNLSMKIGKVNPKYGQIYKMYLNMKENLKQVESLRTQDPRVMQKKAELVKAIVRLTKDLKEQRIQDRIYVDDVRDEQGRFIGIKDGDIMNMVEQLNHNNVLAALDDLCAIGMSSDLCEAVMNLFIRLYFNKHDNDQIPFRVRDHKRMKIEYQRPDRSWTTDMGGTALAKILCMNVCKTILMCSVIFPEIMIREEREIEKNNLMNHFDLPYVQKNLALLHDKKFQLKVIKRLFAYMQNLEMNNDELRHNTKEGGNIVGLSEMKN